jgi:hypothetical protein
VTPPAVKALACPKCGAAITLRSGAQALVVVCESCHSVLDAKDPNLAVLQTFDARMHWSVTIPLGTKGTLKGDPYEAIAFQVRTITEEGIDYSWREYVLWNPYKGYRYLSEYDGHWNDYIVTKTPPTPVMGSDPPVVELHGERFKHFQTAEARTVFILGEFPWQVRVGDKATTSDYVSPPHMLSKEVTEDETTWSIGSYTDPRRIWEAFALPGTPRAPTGVYENQPDDYAPAAKDFAKLFAMFALLLFMLFVGRQVTAADQSVFTGEFRFRPPGSDTSAFVTNVFPIMGRTSNVEVKIHADVRNHWAYFNLSLINDQTGKAIDFGREVSYYNGSDEDGYWEEGKQDDRSFLPAVPAGNYFLRVQPEGPLGGPITIYSITLHRDVARTSWFLIALGVLAAVPLFMGFRAWAFEVQRWRESDHPMVQTNTGGGNDDS